MANLYYLYPMKNYLLLIIIIFCFSCCTPFDSDRLNKKLIQGRWEQVDVISSDADSVFADREMHSATFLQFRGDSCFETLRRADVDRNRYFQFDVNSYVVSLKETDHPTNYLVIAKLTADSLVFQVGSRILKYKRVDQY